VTFGNLTFDELLCIPTRKSLLYQHTHPHSCIIRVYLPHRTHAQFYIWDTSLRSSVTPIHISISPKLRIITGPCFPAFHNAFQKIWHHTLMNLGHCSLPSCMNEMDELRSPKIVYALVADLPARICSDENPAILHRVAPGHPPPILRLENEQYGPSTK